MNKNFIKGVIIGGIIFGSINAFASTTYEALTAEFPIFISGQKWETDKPIVVINGSTYLPLRAIGEALNVKISWNSELNRVEIGNTEEKETVSVSYIGNNNTMKLHLPNCSAIKDIAEHNIETFSSKEDAIGYTPCKICNP